MPEINLNQFAIVIFIVSLNILLKESKILFNTETETDILAQKMIRHVVT